MNIITKPTQRVGQTIRPKKQAKKIKSREMKEGWVKKDEGLMKNDEGWWYQAVVGFWWWTEWLTDRWTTVNVELLSCLKTRVISWLKKIKLKAYFPRFIFCWGLIKRLGGVNNCDDLNCSDLVRCENNVWTMYALSQWYVYCSQYTATNRNYQIKTQK